MISIKVNIQNEVSKELAEFISTLTGRQSSGLNEQGGISARNAAIEYHRQFDQSGGWRGKRYLGKGANEGSSFGADVARGWALESHTSSGAVISNDASYYAFKVTGGTITPKRAKFLTIPLIAEARGVRASVYSQNSGNRLFRPKGKFVLMEKTGKGTARSVYALVSSITMGPWPESVPPDEVIAGAYIETYREGLLGVLAKS
jgi:hypothetical protein